jgi:outer membrane protein insertion porin family
MDSFRTEHRGRTNEELALVSNRAQKTAIWLAAAGLLAVAGGCVGTPLGPASGPNVLTDHPAVRQQFPKSVRPNSVRPGHNASYAPGTSRQSSQLSPATNPSSSGFVTRGQNASGYAYPPASAGQSAFGNGNGRGGVRPVQYESVQPSPAYGTPPGASTVPPAGPTQPGAGAPGNPPWLEGGAPGITVPPYADPVWSESAVDPGPQNYADMIANVQETHTGQFMFGVGVNSDAGLTGQITIQERNFDVFRPPTSWEDFTNGTAWRGGGQGFRAEAMPGTQVQRYMVSLGEPYLFGTNVSFNVSGFFYDRLYFDWDEQRYGGRISFGYRLTPDLSVSTALRAENVDIRDPRVLGVPELDDALGNHDLFSGRISVSQDKRDRYFAPTAGHFIEMSFEQVFGDYDYSRADIDVRKYFLIRERPDTSGRHTLALNMSAGFTGADTPIFENYFAGGYSTIRGFNFRGASPKAMPEGVIVGGRFRFLASAEYMFPITADDMLRMAVFCDAGTVESDIEMRSENFRVAPGFGLRIFVPAMGPAPIALDFAFPVMKSQFDDTQVFSFFVGMGR